MNLKEQFNGIQHIGIPTNDIEATIDFYKALGFEIAFRTVNEEADEEVAFLKLNTLVVETYENKAAKMEAGAIDHMAIDVKDIEKELSYPDKLFFNIICRNLFHLNTNYILKLITQIHSIIQTLSCTYFCNYGKIIVIFHILQHICEFVKCGNIHVI